jgi:hypothetical protein
MRQVYTADLQTLGTAVQSMAACTVWHPGILLPHPNVHSILADVHHVINQMNQTCLATNKVHCLVYSVRSEEFK